MRITVKAENRNIRIPIPTGLVFGKVSIWIWLRMVKLSEKHWADYVPDNAQEQMMTFRNKMSEKAIYTFCAELMRLKRKHGGWKLVEIYTADGEEVLIEL